MTRADLQELANLRLAEAEILRAAGAYSGAYYLVGYAVECALKACVAKQTVQFEFPDKQRVLEAYTHKLNDLVRAAKLPRELESTVKDDEQLAIQWRIVQAWSENSRYAMWTDMEARVLVQAASGVVAWVQQFW